MSNFRTMACCLLLACGMLVANTSYAQVALPSWAEVVHGKWICDVDKTLEELGSRAVTADELKIIKASLAGVSMKITEEGQLNMIVSSGGSKKENLANFEVISTDDKTKVVSIKVQMQQSGSPEKTGKVTVLDEDSIRLQTDDRAVFVFKRDKSKD